MKRSCLHVAVVVFGGLFLCGGNLPAQDNTELLNRLRAMEDRIKALEAEVQSLKGQPPAAAPVAPAAAQAHFRQRRASAGAGCH